MGTGRGAGVVTIEEIEARRALMSSGDLAALLARQTARAGRLLERTPVVPEQKAMLSTDGGICPKCGTILAFDPWSPVSHTCASCQTVATGPRHDGHWARAQHLWIAERAAELAAVAVFHDDQRFAERACQLLAAYYELYHALPNDDNVLGPTHLFFSTYLESIWITNYLAAAHLLRERGWLNEADIEAINAIAEEAAQLIGEFDEGMSNRQTWNAAALTAIAVWFDDEDLAQSAIEGRTGLLGHLTDGFGDDGMWAEGENYHLFAIRGLVTGLEWARVAGADLLDDPVLVATLGRALMAPAATALPDLTFPARKDSRFGVSLAHPAYLEVWEWAMARLGDDAPDRLGSWLAALYRQPARGEQTYDAYLHDAGEEARTVTTRADLSWWMLFVMAESLPDAEPFESGSALLATQGVAVLRQGTRYLAVECGAYGGGHGHPDRLQLTVHAGGVYWLADPGAGSYLSRDLFWYRSTLAHNAPMPGGRSQDMEDARCAAFDESGTWGWVVGEFGSFKRTVIAGPDWTVDLVDGDPGFELPWHLDGEVAVETAGRWEPATLVHEFVKGAEQFAAEGGDIVLVARKGAATVRLHLVGGTVIRAVGLGRPGAPERPFYLVRAGQQRRLAAVLDLSGGVREVGVGTDRITVQGDRGTTEIRLAQGAATIVTPAGQVSLGGARPAPPIRKALMAERPIRTEGRALRVDHQPALDGSLGGFDDRAPLEMADEGHYYRSEEPYAGPDDFSAVAFVNWDVGHLYLAVQVQKPEVVVAPAGTAPLRLDNEPDDIHSDGIQVYYQVGEEGEPRAFVIRPDEAGGILVRSIDESDAVMATEIVGGSAWLDLGYSLTVRLPCPELGQTSGPQSVLFDVAVNEARPGRIRRAGQLAWGGGNGWIYLRGDRRDPRHWGSLKLLG